MVVRARASRAWATWRTAANQRIRGAVGLTQDPPDRCDDPGLSYQRVDAVARLVHGDLASMLVGGVGSLFLEMLHPYSMAGVADHSRYREDTLGRVLQTANFIGVTTYGERRTALATIERVRAIHEAVRGVADDGTPYVASDPHLLEWVHVAGTYMFLRAYEAFGARRLAPEELDEYVNDQVQVARDLGVLDPPTSYADLRERLERFRPELRLSIDGITARDFLAAGVPGGALQRVAYRVIVESSYSLLPWWAPELLGVASRPLWRRAVVRPTMRLLSRAIRAVVPPAPQVTSPRPPSTTRT